MPTISDCLNSICCFRRNSAEEITDTPPPYTPSISNITFQTETTAPIPDSRIVLSKPDVLEPMYKRYLNSDFPDYINSQKDGPLYPSKKNFVLTLIDDLAQTNLNNAEKKAILSLLYIKLMGSDGIPTEKPKGSLSSTLWIAINELQSDYKPVSISVNLGYSGQGNDFPFHLVPEDTTNGMSLSYVGLIDEKTFFSLEVYSLCKNKDDISGNCAKEEVDNIKETNDVFSITNREAYIYHLTKKAYQDSSEI